MKEQAKMEEINLKKSTKKQIEMSFRSLSVVVAIFGIVSGLFLIMASLYDFVRGMLDKELLLFIIIIGIIGLFGGITTGQFVLDGKRRRLITAGIIVGWIYAIFWLYLIVIFGI